MAFTDLFLEDRVRLMNSSHDVTLVYDILSKHLNKSGDEVRSLYKLTGDFVRNTLTINGDIEPIFELHTHVMRFGLKPESARPRELRYDLYSFIKLIL